MGGADEDDDSDDKDNEDDEGDNGVSKNNEEDDTIKLGCIVWVAQKSIEIGQHKRSHKEILKLPN